LHPVWIVTAFFKLLYQINCMDKITLIAIPFLENYLK